MRKTKLLLIGFIYFPLAIIYAITWGIVYGLIGTTLGAYQLLKYNLKTTFRLWKRFPKRSNIKYWDSYIKTKGKLLNDAEKYLLNKKAQKGEKKEPFPLPYAIISSFLFIILTPLYWLYGLIFGPICAIQEINNFWYEKFLKITYQSRLIENLRKDKKNDYF